MYYLAILLKNNWQKKVKCFVNKTKHFKIRFVTKQNETEKYNETFRACLMQNNTNNKYRILPEKVNNLIFFFLFDMFIHEFSNNRSLN